MRSRSLRIYPRIDKEYRKQSSLDFQTVRSAIYQTRPLGMKTRLYSWLIYLILGMTMGFIAFAIDIIVEELVHWKWHITQIVLDMNIMSGWLTYVMFSLLFGGVAAILTVFVAPGAAGGGIAELMGYFNGINYPELIRMRTLLVKIFGLGFAVASGLCIGKEGPLAHIGAIIGHVVLYIPLPFVKYFRNNVDKRELAAAGCAAGVSAAFGSPIGGSLFAYEISRPSTFWSFGLTWKIFFCSSISTFILNILSCIRQGEDLSITNAGLIKFGEYDENPYKLHDFPFFIILGMFGGLLGAFFIFVNYSINKYRKKMLKTKWKKVIEVVALVFITATVLFFAPMLIKNDCLDAEEGRLEASYIPYLCKDKNKEYNPLATFLFNPEGSVIKAFLNQKAVFNYEPLIMYFIIWYLFTIITYGTAVPAGLFLPGILIGCSLGRMVGLFIENYIVEEIHPSTYAIIGAASILAGYSRLSFSLAVIMLETTENVNLFLPIIFALFVSFGVGRIFNRSLYVGAIRFKNIPFLSDHVPKINRTITADIIMTHPVYTLQPRATVKSIYGGLSTLNVNGYPVVDHNERLVGLISRDALITLIKKQCWSSNSDSINTHSELKNQQSSKRGRINSDNQPKGKIFKDEETGVDIIEKLNSPNKEPSETQSEASNSGNRITTGGDRYVYFEEERAGDDSIVGEDSNVTPTKVLTWEDFNCNFHSSSKPLGEIHDISQEHPHKVIDLRPYMIEKPYCVYETDKIAKVLEMFRLMNLRHLPVVNENDNSLVGIITRQDIFAYMSL